MAHLIIWNSFSEPLPVRTAGPYQLAAWLEEFGYDVAVIDFCSLLTTDQLINLTKHHIDANTVAVGVSNTFSDIKYKQPEPLWIQHARFVIEKDYPQIEWVTGGAEPVFNAPSFQMKWKTFTGYAENAILSYLDHATGIVASREQFDIAKLTRHYKDNLSITEHEVLPLQLSRGCVFKCKFCRFPLIGRPKGSYFRDFKLVEQEIISNYERYGTTRYYFVDETTNESTEKIEAIADINSRLPFDLEWIGYVRLDSIVRDETQIELLRKSGLKSCYFGIETFNPYASKIIGKGWPYEETKKDFLLRLRNEWGTDITFKESMMVGLPGETEQELYDTLQWHIDNELYSWSFYPLHITKNSDVLWKSTFDETYEKYGYSFPTDDEVYWENGEWDYDKATEVSNTLEKIGNPYKKASGWIAGQIASLGYSIDEIATQPLSSLPWEMYKQQSKVMTDQYYQSQLKF